jgi:hypothetical protein
LPEHLQLFLQTIEALLSPSFVNMQIVPRTGDQSS